MFSVVCCLYQTADEILNSGAEVQTFATSFLTQFRILFVRTFLSIVRDSVSTLHIALVPLFSFFIHCFIVCCFLFLDQELIPYRYVIVFFLLFKKPIRLRYFKSDHEILQDSDFRLDVTLSR